MDAPKRGGQRDGAGRPAKERPSAVEVEPIGRILADRLSQARAERSLSLRDLAALSGTSAPTVQALLRGEGDPQLSTLRRLAKALRVRLGWLVGE